MRVLIATHSILTGDVMRRALDHQEDVTVTACVTTAREVEPLLAQCDLLLITDRLHQGSTLETITQTHRSHPTVKILVAGVADDPAAIVTYLQAGAAGYVLARESLPILTRKMRALTKDETLLSPAVAARVMSRLAALTRDPGAFRTAAEKRESLHHLTPREHEVLALLSRGYSNDEIAAALTISPGTAKNHVHHIFRKLEVHNRAAAAQMYELLGQAPAPAAAAAPSARL